MLQLPWPEAHHQDTPNCKGTWQCTLFLCLGGEERMGSGDDLPSPPPPSGQHMAVMPPPKGSVSGRDHGRFRVGRDFLL